MKDGQINNQNKKTYIKPKMKFIELVAEEVLGGCKLASSGNFTAATCSIYIPPSCNAVNSTVS